MKTIILLVIVLLIAGVAMKSIYKMLKGESGCSCSKDKEKNCSLKNKCKH